MDEGQVLLLGKGSHATAAYLQFQNMVGCPDGYCCAASCETESTHSIFLHFRYLKRTAL